MELIKNKQKLIELKAQGYDLIKRRDFVRQSYAEQEKQLTEAIIENTKLIKEYEQNMYEPIDEIEEIDM